MAVCSRAHAPPTRSAQREFTTERVALRSSLIARVSCRIIHDCGADEVRRFPPYRREMFDFASEGNIYAICRKFGDGRSSPGRASFRMATRLPEASTAASSTGMGAVDRRGSLAIGALSAIEPGQ